MTDLRYSVVGNFVLLPRHNSRPPIFVAAHCSVPELYIIQEHWLIFFVLESSKCKFDLRSD